MQPEFQNSDQQQTPITQPGVPPGAQNQLQQPMQPQNQSDDPGKSLAIAGIVLAFFFSILGLILSIVARNKSKKAGFDNSLAKIGIILNIVFLVLQAIFIAFFLVAVVFVAKDSIEQNSSTAESGTIARQVSRKVEAYSALNDGTYPKTIAELNSHPESALTYTKVTFVSSPIRSSPDDPNTLEFYTCTPDLISSVTSGNKIGYWNYKASTVDYVYTSYTDKTSSCELTAS